MKTHNKDTDYLSTSIFLIIVLGGFVFSVFKGVYIIKDVSQKQYYEAAEIATNFENLYNEIFSECDFALDIFSITQKLLGKHETRNFEVLKANDGSLYLHSSGWPTDEDSLLDIIEQYKMINEAVVSYGGRLLYVQLPYKNAGQKQELKYYSTDNTEYAEDYIVNYLNMSMIPTLDLRNYHHCVDTYKTDHHWTVESAFNAANVIENEVELLFGFETDKSSYYGNKENYDIVNYEKSLLGSIGIKVGKFYAGRDDFIIYTPKFETDLDFKHYVQHQLAFEHSGKWWQVFINEAELDDPLYNNKYNCLMYGADNESIIINNLSDNNYKILVISHSYGRPLVQYLCLYYKETRYLDPQSGRYNENYLEYIEEYKPDLVILAYNGKINVGQ